MKSKYVIGTIIIVVFVSWGAYNLLESTVQYVSYDKARNSKRSVQVAGHIDFEQVDYSVEKRELVFDIYEMDPEDPSNPDRLTVTYKGVVPGNFDQATSIVVRGYYENNKLIADDLLVKCPSKYQGAAVELEG